MTTAHRATWKAARGGLQEEGSFRLHVPSAAVSSKDAPTERALKVRATVGDDVSRGELRARVGDDTQDFIDGEKVRKRARTRFAPLTGDEISNGTSGTEKQDEFRLLTLKSGNASDDDGSDDTSREVINMSKDRGKNESDVDLPEGHDANTCSEEKEHKVVVGQTDAAYSPSKNSSLALVKNDESLPSKVPISPTTKIMDGTATNSDSEAEGDDKNRDEGESEDSDEESSDEEDEAELRAEVERIRRERALEHAKRQEEERQNQAAEEEEDANGERDIALANPLLASSLLRDDEASETASIATGGGSVGFVVRRRWDDDVVFRHQARAESRHQPRFINDTIHNDFHRRFMKRYMR